MVWMVYTPGTTPSPFWQLSQTMVWVLPGRKLGPWSEFPFLYRFTVLLNSGGSNSPWSEFWSESPHFMGMGVVPAPSSEGCFLLCRGGTNLPFGKPCFCSLPKGVVLTKTANMTNLHSTHWKQGLRSSDPQKRRKMAGVTEAKASDLFSRVFFSILPPFLATPLPPLFSAYFRPFLPLEECSVL